MTRMPNKEILSREIKFIFITQPENLGKCFKFHNFLTGPFEIIAKLTDLNYEITSMNHKKQVVHENRMKMAYNSKIWKSNPKLKISKKEKNQEALKPEEQKEENEMQIRSLQLLNREQLVEGLEPRNPPNQVPHTPESASQTTVSRHSERRYLSYELPHT